MRTLDRLLKACWDAAWQAKNSHFATDEHRDEAYRKWRRNATAPE